MYVEVSFPTCRMGQLPDLRLEGLDGARFEIFCIVFDNFKLTELLVLSIIRRDYAYIFGA